MVYSFLAAFSFGRGVTLSKKDFCLASRERQERCMSVRNYRQILQTLLEKNRKKPARWNWGLWWKDRSGGIDGYTVKLPQGGEGKYAFKIPSFLLQNTRRS